MNTATLECWFKAAANAGQPGTNRDALERIKDFGQLGLYYAWARAHRDEAVVLELGDVRQTPGAESVLRDAEEDVAQLLARFEVGDWGDCSEEGALLNDWAARIGATVRAAYVLSNGEEVMVQSCDAATTLYLRLEWRRGEGYAVPVSEVADLGSRL